MLVLVTTMITFLLVITLMDFVGNSTTKKITYNEFISMVEKGEVEEVILGASQINIIPKSE